jgi:hypothetical protein
LRQPHLPALLQQEEDPELKDVEVVEAVEALE